MTKIVKTFYSLQKEINDLSITKEDYLKFIGQNYGRLSPLFGGIPFITIPFKLNEIERLYRVLKINTDNYKDLTFDELVDLGLTGTSPKKTSIGRLNKEGEKILYTSLDKQTCLSETGVTEQDPYLLITYKVNAGSSKLMSMYNDEKFLPSTITHQESGKNYREIKNVSSRESALLNQLLNWSFSLTKEILVNSERESWIYEISNYIKELYYDPYVGGCKVSDERDEECVGWIYPSIEDNLEWYFMEKKSVNELKANVAFYQPNQKKELSKEINFSKNSNNFPYISPIEIEIRNNGNSYVKAINDSNSLLQ